jgi:hypothetical protein
VLFSLLLLSLPLHTTTYHFKHSLRHPSSLGSQGLLGAFTELSNGGEEEAKTELPETSTSETATPETANTSAGSSSSTTASAQKPLTAAERFQAFLEQSSKNRSAKAAAASKGSAVRDATTATTATTGATAAGTGTATGVNGGLSAGGSSRVTGVHTLQHPGAANLMLQVLQQLVVCTSWPTVCTAARCTCTSYKRSVIPVSACSSCIPVSGV